MRVLVCGSRRFGFKLEERDVVFGEIEATVEKTQNPETSEYEDLVIIHGDAKGVDKAASHWATLCNVPQEAYPADWHKYGRAAGPIRNKQMLEEGKPDLVLAFLTSTSRGTKNMIEQADEAGVPIKIIRID